MAKLTTLCPYCSKPLKLKSTCMLGNQKLNSYECGHSLIDNVDVTHHGFETKSLDGSMEAFEYQKEGVDFAVNETHYNCLIADQMGLGKTIQALLAHRAQYKEKSPALYIVKSATLWQWHRQYKRWCDPLPHGVWLVLNSDSWIPPGFNSYIISMDLIANEGRCKCGHTRKSHPEVDDQLKCKGTKGKKCPCINFEPVETMVDKLLALNFKLCVVDEVHSFKNVESSRSQALMRLFQKMHDTDIMQEVTFTCPFEHDKDKILEKYNIPPGASIADVKKAYREASLKSHPDTGGSNDAFRQTKDDFKKITDIVFTGNGQADRKVTWTEVVKMNVNTRESTTRSTVSHSSKCPVCNSYVAVTAQQSVKKHDYERCGVIMLSGTPVINRASEYFVPLNILDPARFYSLARFKHEWLEPDDKGRLTRIKNWRLEEFRKLISEYVIRRERNEVLKDLPKFRRTYTTIQMDSEELQALYNVEIEKLVQAADAQGRDVTFRDIQANIASMRRIAALAKVDYVVDQVKEFLEETEDEKIALGIHHIAVRDNLMYALRDHHPISISGEDSAYNKDYKIKQFALPQNRVTVINTLAGGVGLDGLQVCNNVAVLERQWSSAYEDQFEDRFNRQGQTRPVTCDYIHIKNTVDDFMHMMVEEKRDIIGETVENDYNPMPLDASAMRFVDWSAANKV